MDANTQSIKLDGLFAFKEGMSTVYNETGEAVPVTILRYEPWFVSQVKTDENDGYSAIQIACKPEKARNANKASIGHLKGAGFENGARLVREIRQAAPEGLAVGSKVDLNSFQKGDSVKITSKSKGHGFTGAVKRWNFAGGPASHGSNFHRRPGSSGNRTWPGRVMPGKKFPGHYGDENITVKNVVIVDVIESENVLLVKGPVPGGRHTLVKIVRSSNG
ncbi:MAG: 50S ribosomal protein L3 [Bdellovibrionota bacterium]